MDAVEFLKERSRMYKSGAATPTLGLKDVYDPVIAVKAVEEWSAAHPRKTRQSVFLEQWPEAEIGENGCLMLCPIIVSADRRNRHGDCTVLKCSNCCREFWMKEVD